MNEQIQAYDKLVSAVYDCAVDPALWPRTLGLIAETYGAAYSGIVIYQGKPAFDVGYHSWHDDVMIRKIGDYTNDLPGMDELYGGPLDNPIATSRQMPFEQFSRTRFFREWANPQGLRDG